MFTVLKSGLRRFFLAYWTKLLSSNSNKGNLDLLIYQDIQRWTNLLEASIAMNNGENVPNL